MKDELIEKQRITELEENGSITLSKSECKLGESRVVFLLVMMVGMMLVTAPGIAAEGQVAESPRIIVGGDYNYPPYEFLDENGNPMGYNVELTRAIAETMGMNVEIKLGPWGEIRKALESGEIDTIHGMFYSEERNKAVDFSPPHTIVHHAIFARRDTPKIESVEELRGKDIIVMRGDIMHDYVLENGLSDSPVLAETQADALRLLSSGEHDYALVAKLPGLYWVRELKLSNIVTVGLFLPSKYCHAEYCYAVKNGNTALLARFSEGLAILNGNRQVRADIRQMAWGAGAARYSYMQDSQIRCHNSDSLASASDGLTPLALVSQETGCSKNRRTGKRNNRASSRRREFGSCRRWWSSPLRAWL